MTRMTKRKGNGNNETKKKQKGDGENTHQLDPIFGQYRALPVSQAVMDSVTSDTVPTNGEVYLAMVRKQAEDGSPVMFIPRLVESDEVLQDECLESEFDQEFHDLVVKEFKHQREGMPDAGVLEIPEDFVFPETFTAWRQYCMTHEPSMELVSNIDHSLTIKLLMYCARWLAPKTPKQISQWIYAILCRVSDVLEASDVSVLRDLGKRAKTLDLREELEETTRFTCKLVIHVVAGGFGQRDLL